MTNPVDKAIKQLEEADRLVRLELASELRHNDNGHKVGRTIFEAQLNISRAIEALDDYKGSNNK